MPAIALPAAWFGGSVLTAAVASAVVTGVAYGAVIGAAAAVVTGQDVLRGALTGAAIGGVTGGVLQGFAGVGAATGGVGGTVPATTPPVSVGAANTEGILHSGPRIASGMSSGMPSATTSAIKPAMSAAEANLWGGAISGTGAGLGKVGAAMIESDAEKDLYDRERRAERERIDRNEPGEISQASPSVTLPERWSALIDVSASLDKYKQPLNKGLLAGGP